MVCASRCTTMQNLESMVAKITQLFYLNSSFIAIWDFNLVSYGLMVLPFSGLDRKTVKSKDRIADCGFTVLELQSLSSLLMNFERSSIMNLMTKSLKPLLSALNCD